MLVTPAEVGIEIVDFRGLQVAPAALLESVPGDVEGGAAVLLAVLELALALAEGAAGQVGLETVVAETVLQHHVERATERIETVDWVRADDVDAVDGDIWNNIPVDRVAERLVEAHSVEVNRKTLGNALQRRGLEAVIEKGRLERITRGGIECDSAQLLVERFGYVRRTDTREVGACQHMRFRWDQVAIDSRADQRRRTNHRKRLQRYHGRSGYRCRCVGPIHALRVACQWRQKEECKERDGCCQPA